MESQFPNIGLVPAKAGTKAKPLSRTNKQTNKTITKCVNQSFASSHS